MNVDRTTLAVVGVVLAILAAMALAALFGANQQGPISESAATQSFRAPSGTQRDSAKALVNEREYAPGKKGTSSEQIEVWGRFDNSNAENPRGDSREESRELAEEVLADLSNEDAIAVLTVELNRTEFPSQLYAALATAYARREPYDAAQVDGAFALSLSTARTPEERIHAIYRHAKVLAEQGEQSALLDLLARTQPENTGFSTRLIELNVLKANALAANGDYLAATRLLREAFDHEESLARLDDPAFENVYRNLALRLTRLYRDAGDDQAATTVGRDLKARIRD